MGNAKHRTDTPNLSKGAGRDPKHGIPNDDTAAIRVDLDASGRLTGFGVGREAGDGNYSR